LPSPSWKKRGKIGAGPSNAEYGKARHFLNNMLGSIGFRPYFRDILAGCFVFVAGSM